jgi:hypothetical protein
MNEKFPPDVLSKPPTAMRTSRSRTSEGAEDVPLP